MRNGVWIGAAAAAAVAVAGGVYWATRNDDRREPPPEVSPHGKQIDGAMAPMRAYLATPDRDTPCATAYDAHVAFERSAAELGRPTPWMELPERGEFLARCSALAPEFQRCLVPSYIRGHGPQCQDAWAELRDLQTLYRYRGAAPSPLEQPPK